MSIETYRKSINFLAERQGDLAVKFHERLECGNLTRDEDPQSHFCVFFAVVDTNEEEVYLGDHIKSGLWLFNGGHIDKGETPQQAFVREAMEELGLEIAGEDVNFPEFLTITDIDNPPQICRKHYDFWFFVRVNKNDFKVDPEVVKKEFNKACWLRIPDARKKRIHLSTLTALDYVEENIFD